MKRKRPHHCVAAAGSGRAMGILLGALAACAHAGSSIGIPGGSREVATTVSTLDKAGLRVGLDLRVTYSCGDGNDVAERLRPLGEGVMMHHSIIPMLTNSGQVSDAARSELQDEVRSALSATFHDRCVVPEGVVLLHVTPPDELAAVMRARAQAEADSRAMAETMAAQNRAELARIEQLYAAMDAGARARAEAEQRKMEKEAEADIDRRLARLDASPPD